MSDNNLKAAIEACGIEEAERIIAEMKAKPKWDADVWFRKLIEGMELRTRPDRPGVNLWDGLIDGERVTLFEQDTKNGKVWCRWSYVWQVLEDNHSTRYGEVQAKMKLLLEEHLKWRVETTGWPCVPT